ncbi:MAG: ABC transporter substrate-binding protein [Thermodesulfobacteriota bacterium]|nr:MAG: ABC transporter substrate-binding protein [Thermodesulfobacteriota bacterium]
MNPLTHRQNQTTALFYSWYALLLVIVFLSEIACRQSLPKKEGFLYLRLNTNPTTLDPALIVDVTGASIGAKLFNGLVRFDRDLTLQPDIAEKWEISPGGTTYTFYLHQGILFSNGREVTADDVKYSFERVLNPATRSPRTWVLDRIEGAQEFMQNQAKEVSGIRVKGRYTLTIQLKKPFTPFLSLLSLTNASVVPKEEVEKWGADFSSHVVGTGPFMLQEWQHSQQLCLVANPKFFRSPPHLKGVVYRIIPEDLTTIVEFEIGNLDIIRIPAPEFHKYYTHPGKYSIKEQPGINIYYLGLNCQQPPLNDIRVRQAISFAIDREKIRTTLFEKRGFLASGPIPPLLRKSFSPLKDPFTYNPAKARELLKQAGYPDGFPLTITITALPEVLDIVEVIQQYLQEVEINVSIVQLEWSSFKEAVARGKAQAFWLSWWADYPDAENFLFPLFHSSNWGAGGNRSFYKNPAVDLLIEKAQQEPDLAARIHLFHEAEETIINDAPVVFFWHQTDYYLEQPRVKNFIPYPLTTSEDGTDIYLTQSGK